jgi:hypothetical protein
VSVKRFADWLIYTAICAFIAFSFYLTVILPVMGTELSKYEAAFATASCPLQRALSSDSCVALLYYYVVGIGTAPIGLNDSAATITLSPSQTLRGASTYYVNRPPGVYDGLKQGAKVQLKVWNGRATGVLYQGSSFRLFDNPYDVDDLRFYGGISLGALALVLLAVHPPAVLRRKFSRRRGENPPANAEPSPGLASKLAHDAHMRIALVVFTIGQLFDVITSIRGGRLGLYEGNPVAAMLIEHVGWTIGLLMLKVIAVAAIVLVFSRLPRRSALIVTWATSAVFFYVALDNFGLANTVGHPI